MPSNAARATQRADAIRNLESGQAAVEALVTRLSDAHMEQPDALAGGSWSAKDLVGHLAAWEELALETIHAWRGGQDLPTDWPGTDAFNARVREKTSRQSLAEVRRHASDTHAALVQAIQSMTDDEWLSSRGEKTFSDRLGGITGGPAGNFRHAFDHVEELQAFVDSAGADSA